MRSRRVEAVKPSATMKISSLAKELKRQGEDVIDLGVGEPDFPTPPHIIEAVCKAAKEGKTKYAPTRGIPELLTAIAEKLREENGIDVTEKNIIVTPGAKYAIYEAMMSLIDEGDEVILLDPSWVSYEACVLLAGGKPVWVKHEEGFEDAPIEEHITSRTKMIVINTPNNPLGVVYSKVFLKKVRDLAVDHDVFVLSDEIYEKIIFEGKHYSLASFDDMLDRTITINGFSKTYSMTGFRLGYAAAPEWIIREMDKIQSHSVSSPTTFVQYAGLSALKGDHGFLKEMVAEFKRRRDYLVQALSDLGLEFAPPKGAFYMFVKIGKDSEAFCEEFLREKKVAVTPGSAFGVEFKDWIRISYATSMEKLKEAVNRLKEFLEM